MSAGYFVTGTDTGIGKTVVSAILVQALLDQGQRVAYMKPVQTGCEQRAGEWIAPDPEFVARATGVNGDPDLVCPYRFPLPASPHLAAAEAGTHIELDPILAAYRRLQTDHDALVVEGAGGVMVPLNKTTLMLDAMKAINLPVVIVARAGLGTLNHTLLTVRAIRDAKLECAGLVLVQHQVDDDPRIEADNRRTLERLGEVPVWTTLRHDPALARNEINCDYIRANAKQLPLNRQ